MLGLDLAPTQDRGQDRCEAGREEAHDARRGKQEREQGAGDHEPDGDGEEAQARP